MKRMTSALLLSCLAVGLSTSSYQTVQASEAQSTTCYYTLIAGAPWADKYLTTYHSGHIQCEATIATAIGYYGLTGQVYQ